MEGASGMEWSRDQIIQLIELYREREILWNPKNHNFKNKNLKNYASTEISDDLKIEKTEAMNKMKSVISQFQREVRKGKSGSAADTRPKWWAFESLTFLKDKTTPRSTIEAGITETTEESQTWEDEAVGSNSSCNVSLPGPSSTAQIKKKNIHPIVEQAYETMKKLEQKVNITRDEHDVFGEFVASQLRKIQSEEDKITTKRKITNILFDAELSQLHGYRNTESPLQPRTSQLLEDYRLFVEGEKTFTKL